MPQLAPLADAARALLALRDPFAAVQAGALMAATSPWSGQRQPTPAELEANDYARGPAVWRGFRLLIESPAGTVREGSGPEGPWRNTVQAHYGFFDGTRGADGEGVDVFLGPAVESPFVWVLNQTDAAGAFDEHKVLAGFLDRRHALDAYRLSYRPDWDRFGDPVLLSLVQLRWWLTYGDLKRPLTPDIVPPETDMDETTINAPLPRVLWDSVNAAPVGHLSLDAVLYRIRVHDRDDGLIFDPMTLADVTEGAELLAMDALVTLVGRLKPKMEALMRVMEFAGGDLKPLSMQITEPMRRYGGAHVAVIFELSDGQTITVWFHNPDSTPAKLSPADDLVSWKWQLNKKDITIVVAPENGLDLNVREVARRIMRLAAKNSAAFARANVKRAEKVAEIVELRGRLEAGQAELARLNGAIEVAKVAREDRAAKPAWKARDFDPVANYLSILTSDEALTHWQDRLDAAFGERIVAVRNALRALGWDGPDGGWPLTFGGASVDIQPKQVGAGRNVVGVQWIVTGNVKRSSDDPLTDTLEGSAEDVARELHQKVMTPEGEFAVWEGDVIAAVEQQGGMSTSDAQGLVMAHEADMRAAFAAKKDAATVATELLATAPPAGGETDNAEPDWGTYPEGEYAQWEDKLTTMVEFRMQATRGDAQGLVEAQDMMDRGVLRRLFESNYTAEAAYLKLFDKPAGTDGGDPAPDPAPAPTPEPTPPAAMPENVFADIEPEAFALLAANPKAYATAALIEREVAASSGAIAWVQATTEPAMPAMDSVRHAFDSLFELDGARFVRGDISYRGRAMGSVTVNGEGQAFFTKADGSPFNGMPEDDLPDAIAAGMVGWTREVEDMVGYMLALEERDMIDADIASAVNRSENAGDDAEQDGEAAPATVLDRANEHWKRLVSDLAAESRGGRTALLGILHKGGRRLVANLVLKRTNRADWYVVLHEEGKAKVKESIPFPSMRGNMKALLAATYLMGYLDADEPSGWRIAPPGVAVEDEAKPAADVNPVLKHAQEVRRALVARGYVAGESILTLDFMGAMHSVRWSYEGPDDAPTGAVFRAVKLINGVQVDELEYPDDLTSEPEIVAAKFDSYVRAMDSGDSADIEDPDVAPAETAEAKFLREVKAGTHDAVALGDLLERIEAAVKALSDTGQLTGDLDATATEAINHWVELDQQANG